MNGVEEILVSKEIWEIEGKEKQVWNIYYQRLLTNRIEK